MDFLLECIGFPPDLDLGELTETVLERGEAAAWRGPGERHRRLPLGGGLELRLDREEHETHWTLFPYFQAPQRIRISVASLRRVPDSPFDALLHGWVAPPVDPQEALSRGEPPGAYALSAFLTDARRIPPRLQPRHVLAVRVGGFALDVSYVGPNAGVRDARILDRPQGAKIQPLGGFDDPGGCAELSARIRTIRHLRNPLTGRDVDLLELDAPERPLHVFLSPWQLQEDELPAPRPGWRVEGTFLFTGRVAGGLPTRGATRSKAFG